MPLRSKVCIWPCYLGGRDGSIGLFLCNSLSVLGIVGIFVVLLGIAQHFMQIPLGGDWIDPEANPLLKTRVYSTWENPNILAGYLCMLGAYLMAFIRNLKNKKWRWAFFMHIYWLRSCVWFIPIREASGALCSWKSSVL
jgi:vacuolar-type H+-ATPase subunit I/STV1